MTVVANVGLQQFAPSAKRILVFCRKAVVGVVCAVLFVGVAIVSVLYLAGGFAVAAVRAKLGM